MLHFDSDYMEGAHPELMRRLAETNFEQTSGYGTDQYTVEAKELIRDACGLPDANIYFLIGGTQTNATVIDGLLARHEGVLAAETAHINVHESGAIEASGHKVLVLPQHEGKVKAEEVKQYITDFYADETFEHMVAPGMLYISHPGLAANNTDVTLKDIARLCDVFYIGGTKVGALFGEAVVVTRPKLLPHFFSLIKQHGALLAKGRLLGLQFATLFSDGLYLKIARHAIDMAMKLKKAFVEKGYNVYIDSPTNQQFFRLPNECIDRLMKHATFELWGPRGKSDSVVRFVTDWATREEDVDELISYL